MKRILQVFVLLLITSCVSTSNNNDTESKFVGWNLSERKIPTFRYGNKFYELRHFGYKVNSQTNEIVIKTDGIYRYDLQHHKCSVRMFICLNSNVLPAQIDNICSYTFSTALQSMDDARRVDWPWMGNGSKSETYELPTTFKAKCWNKDEFDLKVAQEQKELEEQRLASELKILEERKSICRKYGFKDETDGMGLCLIELDKLDAIKNQITTNNIAQSNLIAQQQAELIKQQQAQALINLGAIIGGAGVPNNPQPIPSSPSYPESYSMSRTVPSNQNCPLLGVPLKKQEVKNGNRICYY